MFGEEQEEDFAADFLKQFRLGMRGRAWLIECGGNYYCKPGQWCNCVDHARKFETAKEAEEVIDKMPKAMLPHEPVAAEHIWVN